MTLKGSLNGVDLLGLVHTLASCEDLAGHIVIHNDRHDTVGEITIKDASIVAASSGRTRGDDGFHELMLSAPANGGFSFREAGPDTGTSVKLPDAISTPTAQLVLEAMRIKDELKWFRETYGLKGANVEPAPDSQLEFEGPDLGIAMKVWNELQCGRTIAELLKGGTMLRELKLYGVLRHMIESGQAVLKEPKPTSDPDLVPGP